MWKDYPTHSLRPKSRLYFNILFNQISRPDLSSLLGTLNYLDSAAVTGISLDLYDLNMVLIWSLIKSLTRLLNRLSFPAFPLFQVGVQQGLQVLPGDWLH